MPWESKADVGRHNKAAAKSPKKRRVWKHVANTAKQRGLSDASAIREANAVAGRMYGGRS